MEEKDNNKIEIEINSSPVAFVILIAMSAGGLGVIFYSDNPIIITTGLIFGLVGLACVLAKYHVNNAVIQILLGLMLILLGFVLPIVAGIWPLIFILGIFGICGVIVVVKGVTKLTGNEGGEIDQAIDEKLDAAGDKLVDVMAASTDKSTGGGLSAFVYIPMILKGVFMILFSLIFIGIGGFTVYKGEYIGIIFCGAGLGICLSGISSIKEALDVKNGY